MNLLPSEVERRLQTQQLRAAQESEDDQPSNPFAAALGIGVIAALIWSLYVSAEFLGRIASMVRGWL